MKKQLWHVVIFHTENTSNFKTQTAKNGGFCEELLKLSQNQYPHGAPPPLKMNPLSEKHPPRPLKHETPFHELIPRKSTINNHLKSS